MQDDYYLNLVDWSAGNVLSVALGSNVCVYVMNILLLFLLYFYLL